VASLWCAPGGTLHHLYVVPDLWQGMMGDDWLNNARTRIAFGDYLEDTLGREVAETLERMKRVALARGLVYRALVRLGQPAACLLALSRELDPELVVIGSPRPKGAPGLRSRLDPEQVVRGLGIPLLIVPHPDA
jgi:nucleotide-binding universal stress UspA family protein